MTLLYNNKTTIIVLNCLFFVPFHIKISSIKLDIDTGGEQGPRDFNCFPYNKLENNGTICHALERMVSQCGFEVKIGKKYDTYSPLYQNSHMKI